MYGFKECSSCGALYNKSCGCSKGGFVDKFVRDPNKTPDSSQLPPRNCPNCGNPVDGLYCRQCALLRKKLEEVWGPHDTFQCQPMNQNFDNSNSSGFDQFQPPQYPVIHHPPQETSVEMLQARENLMESIQTFLKKFNRISFREMPKELADFINTLNWNCLAFYNNYDDEEYTIAITPILPTVEPDNSLSMGDEHLSTIPEKEESSVEDLVSIPNLVDSNDDYSSSDDDSLYSEDIYYIDASPPDSELVSLEEVKDFEDGEIDIDILLTIKDDILREKLSNINLLIAKNEALKDNPTPSSDFVTKSPSTSPNSFLEGTNISYNFLPDSETFPALI
ncbi:hypothetical protein Tco_1092489 [Tanacetum coccineum]|uniref:Uncharacterized protein n=1 Tax=Tanacetum coccineum TaxID=301880 RepID=A0ABQ5IB63_9ASTR